MDYREFFKNQKSPPFYWARAENIFSDKGVDLKLEIIDTDELPEDIPELNELEYLTCIGSVPVFAKTKRRTP